MATLDIDSSSAFVNSKGKHFLLIGDEGLTPNTPGIREKIERENTEHDDRLWATLGNSDGSPLNWKGKLKQSRRGNRRFRRAVKEEVANLKRLNPSLTDDDIQETFLNFDKVKFDHFPETFTLDQIPQMRLELFLKDTEGALVFYEMYRKGYREKETPEVDYILPEATEGHSTNRDRLTYLMDILPHLPIEQVNPGEKLSASTLFKVVGKKGDVGTHSFVVKVLRFARDNAGGDAKTAVEKILHRVEGQHRYGLLKFDPEKNEFFDTLEPAETRTIDTSADKKTLFLVHGTFVTIPKTYRDLLKETEGGNSWLQKQLEEGHYDQIIGFNYPSVAQRAETNVAKLKELLVQEGLVFEEGAQVHMMCTSMGGLLGKLILADDELQSTPGSPGILPVSKAILTTTANGVHWFRMEKPISRLLSLSRKGCGASGLGLVVTLAAQYSIKFFLSMEGCKQMMIDHEYLKYVLDQKPANDDVKVLPLIGDWDKRAAKGKFLRRLGERGLDKIIWLVFRQDNDWVVATAHQAIMPDHPSSLQPKQFATGHLGFYAKEDIVDEIEAFFQD